MYLLQHLLKKSAVNYPDNIAIQLREETLSYAMLEEKSNQLAAVLLRDGVQTGDRVGIMLSKSIESIISLFGILKTGAIYVPIDPQMPDDRKISIIKNSNIKFLISSLQYFEGLLSELNGEELPINVVIFLNENLNNQTGGSKKIKYVLWETIFEITPHEYDYLDMADTSPAYILHTSGSTGTPKGVVISHLNALTFVNMAASFFNIHADDVIANHAPLHFDLSVFDIFTSIKQGAKLLIIPEILSIFPLKMAEYIEEHQITVWNSVSSVLSMIAEKGSIDKLNFKDLRLVQFSGDIMPVKYLKILMQSMKNTIFYNIYGQTEANSSMYYKITNIPEDDTWKIPIGKPFPNFEVFALNDSDEIIDGPDEEGELYIKGSTIALGYLNDEEKTREKFVHDRRNLGYDTKLYRTGDLVKINVDGDYVFAGRKDHMIKSRGYRIELDEIEIVLNSHISVRQAIVIAIPDEVITNQIIALVCLNNSHKFDSLELKDYCSIKLPSYMVPEEMKVYDNFPKTSSGKIDRKALIKEFMQDMP